MRLSHALYYFLMEQFYFSGLTMATAVLPLMIYYVFRLGSRQNSDTAAGRLVFAVAAWRQVMLFWLQRFNVRPMEERATLWARHR